MKHLVLVGLPGAGKTTVGQAAAAKAGLPFLDFDEEIERRSGLTPVDFFRERGEAAFRAAELELSRELVGRHTIVVAPGGGWIAQPQAHATLRPYGSLVYLKVTPETAVRRLGEGALLRPLLRAAGPLAGLQRLLSIRGPLYESADHVVDTEAVDLQGVIDHVTDLAKAATSEPG